jgi:hypothetical protein
LNAFESVLRRVFGTKLEEQIARYKRKFFDEKLHNSYSSPTISVMNSRRMRLWSM